MTTTLMAVPTLGTTTLLTNPSDQILYTIRHYVAAPKNATVTFVEETVSLSRVLAEVGHRKDRIREPVMRDLQVVLGRIFPEGVTVEVNTQDVSEVRYRLSISVQAIRGGQPYQVTNTSVFIDNGEILLDEYVPVVLTTG